MSAATPDLRIILQRERAEHVAAIARIDAVLVPEKVDAKLLTIGEAMTEFRRSDSTVRRWAKDLVLGELIDGRWYLDRAAVESFLDRRA